MVGAYVEWEVKVKHGQTVVAGLGRRAARRAPLIGALTHLLVMRQLRRASPLARIVATLGVLIVLQAGAVLRYGAEDHVRALGAAASRVLHPFGITVSIDRFILVGIAAVLSVVLWAALPYTKFGLATTAVAENQRAASAVGLSPDRIATANWALGSALAGVAAILIAPIVQLQVADDDQPRAGGPGRRARRQLPLVPDRLRRRHGRSASARPSSPATSTRPAWPARCRSS